jgi:tRNA A-37 threonylcarbamoyl transferase component Bud32/tetratricopeptide (TPR) repeat protein
MELIGRYFGHIRVLDLVGQGGMGEVYAGIDEALQRKVALKVLHADRRLDSEARERLLREARALSLLDHPNICRIHDFLESDDLNILVLEYIEGETLQDAIAAGKLSRIERLRIAEAVAGVLVVAHRAGIVHRDLKPENVMLTVEGQVKVLDFGLSRWLTMLADAQPKPAEMPPAPTPGWRKESDPAATAAGVAMGTPLYMSPEQARGDALTSASDMYAFGLLLQMLFTGKEPYPAEMTGPDIMIRAGRGDSLPVDCPERAVTALIVNLKQLAPSDRLTAAEAVTRIRWIAAKNRRIARRAAVAAIVALPLLGGWRYTVDLRHERARADAARAEAVAGRAAADDLIGFMLGDLQQKLIPLEKLDILDDVAAQTLKYSSSLHLEALSAQELIHHSMALNQLGAVRMGQGKQAEALDAVQRSLVLSQLAVQRDPRGAEAELARATSHYWIGYVSLERGDNGGALMHFQAYLDAAQRLHQRYPSEQKYRTEIAYAHANVGSALEARGDLAGALAHYRTSFEAKERYASLAPADPARQADVAVSLDKIGIVLMKRGDLEGAGAIFDRETGIHERLLGRNPKQMNWKRRLATALAFRAVLAQEMGQLDDSLQRFTEEQSIERALAARDPKSAILQRALGVSTWRIGDNLRLRGSTEKALRSFRESETIFTSLLQRDATRDSWRRDLAAMRVAYARALAAGSRPTAAHEQLSAALKLLSTVKDDRARAIGLSNAYQAEGELEARRGNKLRARDDWTRAEALIHPIAAVSTDPAVLDLWTRSLAGLDRRPEAEATFARLDRMGYRHPDLLTAWQRGAPRAPIGAAR